MIVDHDHATKQNLRIYDDPFKGGENLVLVEILCGTNKGE